MKIAAPLACLLLPLIALFFAATGPPFPRPVHTLIACAIIAVTHALATSPSPARWATAASLDPRPRGLGARPSCSALVALGMGWRLAAQAEPLGLKRSLRGPIRCSRAASTADRFFGHAKRPAPERRDSSWSPLVPRIGCIGRSQYARSSYPGTARARASGC